MFSGILKIIKKAIRFFPARSGARLRTIGEAGFSLVEILIALAITAMLMGGIYGVYNTFYKQTSGLDLLLEAQQNARAGVYIIEKEIILIGHAVDSGTNSIITADASELEFRYVDPATNTQMKVHYQLQSGALVKQECEQSSWSGCTDFNYYSVINDLDAAATGAGLAFDYYDATGVSIATPITGATLASIRFVKVTLAVVTSEVMPSSGATKSVTLATEVKLRNFDISSSSADTTEPSTPGGLEVREASIGSRVGICGRLVLKWTMGTEGDLAYYRVFYTYGGVEQNAKVLLTALSDDGTDYFYTLAPGTDTSGDWKIQHSPSDNSAVKTYDIVVRAYDNAHNASTASATASGNPSTSRDSTTFGDGGLDDTTINPSKPSVVSGFTAADGASDGEVALSWSSYDTTNNPDVEGLRIYRNTGAYSSYPLTASGNLKWIASEPGGGKSELTESATSFTDTDSVLLGCSVYYYAIAPVSCDATLITDEGGDPTSDKYIASNYAETYGDGTGSASDSPSGADTAPPDTAAPTAPSISVRAGWKRVAVSLTQSASVDLSQMCVYVNEGSDYPSLNASFDTDGCFTINTTDTPSAILIPDSGGIFTTAELSQSSDTAFWHDSMTQESPSMPSLAEIGTYSYNAVAFDICGNSSALSLDQDTTILCGEDPPSGEKPPAVTSASAACCDDDATCCESEPTGVTLSWTEVSSDLSSASSVSNPYDLAGYRIFRSTSTDFSGATLISGSAPIWASSYQDTGAVDGETYYYKIATTDCPYEKVDPSDATILSDTISGTLNSVQLGPVTPGRLQRDEKCEGSGTCTQDDHRKVLTGVDIASDNTSSISTTDEFYHNKITIFIRNTSAGTLTVQEATVSWINSDAELKKITIGGGRSGVATTVTSISATPTVLIPSGGDLYTRTVSGISISSAIIDANARYVPVTFEFKDSGSSADVDMRDDTLRVTFNVQNDSTSTTSCVSYLTVSQAFEGTDVPTGPSVTAVQQDEPDTATYGYAVPSFTGVNTVDSGTDGPVIVDSGIALDVSAIVSSNTTDASTGIKVDIDSVKLYYITTAKTITTAPTTGYTEVSTLDSYSVDCTISGSAGSDTCTGTIPAQSDKRVWYYVVATDSDGNFDRDPEIADGAYVYDQLAFDVCNVTPSAPTGLGLSVSVSDVTITWTAVTTYTNATTIDGSLDTITYEIYRDGTQIATTTALTYDDTGLADGVYSYYIKAENTCGTPVVSDASDTAASCVGLGANRASMNVSPTSITSGGSYTVTIVDCLALDSDTGHDGHVDYINDSGLTDIASNANSFTSTSAGTSQAYAPVLTESSATSGTFTATVTTATDNSANLMTDASDTITVYYEHAVPTTATVTVTADPCDDTPNSPGTLSGSVSGNSINLNWAAVTTNTDGSAITDLGGYRVYEMVEDNGGSLDVDWFLRTTTDSSTTSTTVSFDHGNKHQHIYYFKVTAVDTCGTVNESNDSPIWSE
jgi:prepilin-type N-terminal cleavage/methylation domain-containing protein